MSKKICTHPWLCTVPTTRSNPFGTIPLGNRVEFSVLCFAVLDAFRFMPQSNNTHFIYSLQRSRLDHSSHYQCFIIRSARVRFPYFITGSTNSSGIESGWDDPYSGVINFIRTQKSFLGKPPRPWMVVAGTSHNYFRKMKNRMFQNIFQ
jgi:hypothetical protein